MEANEYITIDYFCKQHGIEVSVISTMQEYGLIEVYRLKETEYLPISELGDVEKLVRLYIELEINPEGIDAIIHLLRRIKDMQSQIQLLENKLSLYEGKVFF
jgi:chaperone modulatory protein CbpM